MSNLSRRGFIGSGVALAGMAAVPAGAQNSEAHTLTRASGSHASVKVIDTDAMPWPPADGPQGWNVKTLFQNEQTGDHLTIIRVGIGSDGAMNHYHDFHEWAYWLSGDFVNNEYTSPNQRVGVFQQFREGTFLDRPAYSLHGGEVGRLQSQVGGTCLIMEEGGKTINVTPGQDGYSDEWRNVKQWSVPRIIDTLTDIPWEPHDQHGNVSVKRLVDDATRGFRAVLWRIPYDFAAEDAPSFARAHFYKKAHQFNFVLAGDLRIQAYETPRKEAQTVSLGENFYFERPPMAICGLAKDVITERGCVWLEVTYGEGTSLPSETIEDPTYV